MQSDSKTLARETRSPARVETCEGPRPTVKCRFFRSAGACPARALHGEGQALALREGAGFLPPPIASRPGGLSYRGNHRFMKHPQLNDAEVFLNNRILKDSVFHALLDDYLFILTVF